MLNTKSFVIVFLGLTIVRILMQPIKINMSNNIQFVFYEVAILCYGAYILFLNKVHKKEHLFSDRLFYFYTVLPSILLIKFGLMMLK